MTTGEIIRLALQALVLAAWAVMVLRMVRTLRARDGGVPARLRHWLTSEEDRADRKTLAFLTFVLVAMRAIDLLAAGRP